MKRWKKLSIRVSGADVRETELCIVNLDFSFKNQANGSNSITRRRAAQPPGCARCGAGADCLSIKYLSLMTYRGTSSPLWIHKLTQSRKLSGPVKGHFFSPYLGGGAANHGKEAEGVIDRDAFLLQKLLLLFRRLEREQSAFFISLDSYGRSPASVDL